jgi:hypothetical protein
MLVVMPVMGSPPERALLCGHATQEGEAKLKKAACLITAM